MEKNKYFIVSNFWRVMMLRKNKLILMSGTALLIAMLTISAAGGWHAPLAQMDMPTGSPLPQSTQDLTTPRAQDTPTPAGDNLDMGVSSPNWTSIFTGFTPYPNATYGSYGSGMGSMGGMGMSGGYYGTGTPMSGMGSMGSMGGMSGMGSGSCSMMGSSGMSMNSTSGDYSMSGMDMSGMNMTGMNGYVAGNTSVFSNPWLLIGWVLLGVLVLAILVGIGVGIAWLIRRPRQTPLA
jgi:hypothetical protein